MRLDRIASDTLMHALQSDPYVFLPTLVRLQPSPGTLDLRFRSDFKKGTSEATLYAGERALLRLIDDGKGSLKLSGPDSPVLRFSPEGIVQAAACSRLDCAVLDRESMLSFNTDAERRDILNTLREPVESALAAHRTAADKPLPSSPKLGQEADAIAVEPDGSLAIIEIKPNTQTGSIGWTPAQVTFYANVFQHWVDDDQAAARETLRKMLGQRITLGLAPTVELSDPIRIKPVIALQHGLTNSKIAQQRAEELQAHLLRNGIGWSNLEARSIGADGSMADLGWFR